MKIDIITLFPEIALGPLNASMIKRAQEAGRVEVNGIDLRQYAEGKHRKTDDYLCGGGQGMLLKPEPIFNAVEDLRGEGTKVILMTPQGRTFDQAAAETIASEASHLIIICGHYEGVDHRVIDELVDEEWSIGDYILTNGALAAAVLVDAVVRLIPEVLGDERSAREESFSNGLLEAPAYTKPADYKGMKVPEILLSGHQAKIAEWKQAKALERTQQNRPDLLKGL